MGVTRFWHPKGHGADVRRELLRQGRTMSVSMFESTQIA